MTLARTMTRIGLISSALLLIVTSAVMAETTLYGSVRSSISWVDTDDSEFAPGFDSDAVQLNSHNSRLGIRGSEDLGNGLSAIYQLEFGVALDQQATDDNDFWYMRNSFVGLQGGFGRITLGVKDSAYRNVTERVDPFSDTFGDFNNILGRVGGSSWFNNRYNNSVNYGTPTWAGLRAYASYAVDRDEKGDNLSTGGDGEFNPHDPNADYAYSVALKYKGSLPVRAAVAYEDQEYDEGARTAAAYKGIIYYMHGDRKEDESWGKIGGVFEHIDLEDFAAADYDDSHNNYIGFGKFQYGAHQIRGTYGHAGEIKSGPDDFDTGETTADYWAAGYQYNLSKNTRVWLEYAGVSNGEYADYGLGQVEDDCSHYIPENGAGVKALALGIRHDF